MNALEITDLHKHFGKNHAVSGVSLEVKPGEIFGFLGPNGAGKSTTIRCIMDFIRPTSGSVNIFGKDAQRDSVALKREVGYVPAEPNLYPAWTVDEHIAFVDALRGQGKKQAAKLKAQLGLSGTAKVKHLSTGNQQKLAIILGLIGQPKLLILDEPTRGLDPLLQSLFHQLLRDYRDAGGAVFLSSHNLPEVDELCDRFAVIRAGQLVDSTELAHLRERNAHMVRVVFADKVPTLSTLGLKDAAVNGKVVTGTAAGDINITLRQLSKHKVSNLEVSHVGLEQLFEEIYKG